MSSNLIASSTGNLLLSHTNNILGREIQSHGGMLIPSKYGRASRIKFDKETLVTSVMTDINKEPSISTRFDDENIITINFK